LNTILDANKMLVNLQINFQKTKFILAIK